MLTSAGVVGLGDFLSATGFEFKGRGDDFSAERREACNGEGDSDSGLDTPLPSLLTLGVAGDVLLGVAGGTLLRVALLGVAGDAALFDDSDKPDLSYNHNVNTISNNALKCHILIKLKTRI